MTGNASGTYKARFALIASLGAFALVAQIVLFRDFFTVFEGNELGVGAFFTSWLAWIALGALAGRGESRAHRMLTRHFPFAVLLYIPAILLQHTLVPNARALAGVQAYELFPFARMAAMAFGVNAPVSFLTGLFFTRACQWAADTCDMPVARVYIFETLGSCIGAVVATMLLARGMPGECVIIWASWCLGAAAIGAVRAARPVKGPLVIGVALLLLVPLHGGLGARWAEAARRAEWARLLPPDTYHGAFATAQARYLYGERGGQFIVMSGGGVCETLPAEDHAAEVVALHLAQKPDARNILVFGLNSLGICTKLKSLPQERTVTWLHPDPYYPKALLRLLDEKHIRVAVPDEAPAEDMRAAACASGAGYDLVILNLPDITTLVRNRYCTREFFRALNEALPRESVVSIRISGGTNYVGAELVHLGASMLDTLESVFERVVLKPGGETFLIASDGGGLAQSPAILRDRFAGIVGADGLYPREGLLALYPPDRVAFQLQAYARIDEADRAMFRNTDQRPSALFFSLLIALKQAGWGAWTQGVLAFAKAGAKLLAYPILLYGLLRLVYLLTSRRSGSAPGVFDARVLVFTAGFAGMAANVVFLFRYQVRHGSLFLDVGLLTALFMLGSFLGSRFAGRVLAKGGAKVTGFLAKCLAAHLALVGMSLASISFPGLSGVAGRFQHVLPFLLWGAITGVHFPIAAKLMALGGRTVTVSGADLETTDHLGGAAGALIAGLIVLPVLGNSWTLAILALLLGVNFVPVFARGGLVQARGDWFDRFVRPAGYAMFGVGALFLIESGAWERSQAGQEGERLLPTAREMAAVHEPGVEFAFHEERASLGGGETAAYVRIDDAEGETQGYVFDTRALAPGVYGYGGPICLAAYVDPSGVLREYRVLRSNETPLYLDMLTEWRCRLIGKNLFEPGPFAGIDALSGATVTSDAILLCLETAGGAFARHALGMEPGEPSAAATRAPSVAFGPETQGFLALAVFLALAAGLRHSPGRWPRRVMLAAAVAVGLHLNLQYSVWHAISLVDMNVGVAGLSGAFFLMVGVPLAAALFGNVYCGYVCPFGALQELVGDFAPGPWRADLGKRTLRYGRCVKYLLLLLLVLLYAVTRDYSVLNADPLITIFSAARGRTALAVAAACLVLSLFYKRFWCRNLCPAGAFLSLLNGARVLRRIEPFKRLVPPRNPARCDLGVSTDAELDCIYCDRCAVMASPTAAPSRRKRDYFHAAVLALALVLAYLSVSWARVSPGLTQPTSYFAQQGAGTAGKPRDLDIDEVKRLILRERLSDHEAEYYAIEEGEGSGE